MAVRFCCGWWCPDILFCSLSRLRVEEGKSWIGAFCYSIELVGGVVHFVGRVGGRPRREDKMGAGCVHCRAREATSYEYQAITATRSIVVTRRRTTPALHGPCPSACSPVSTRFTAFEWSGLPGVVYDGVTMRVTHARDRERSAWLCFEGVGVVEVYHRSFCHLPLLLQMTMTSSPVALPRM